MRKTTLPTLLGLLAWAFNLMNMETSAQTLPAKVGDLAPAFTLSAADGKVHSLSDFRGKYVVLEWTNHQCPFVKKHYHEGHMQALQKASTDKGVVWLSICSSASGKQGFLTPEQGVQLSKEQKVGRTALLLDPDGKVGHLYGAKTTPHMFVINPEGRLIYGGAIDDKPSTDSFDIATSKNYVQTALDEAMAGKKVSVPFSTPYGCSVKY